MKKRWWGLGLALVVIGCSGVKAGDSDIAATAEDAGGLQFDIATDTGTPDVEADIPPTPDVAADTGAPDISTADAEADVPATPDVPKADGGCTEAGCACTANSNCDSGFCIETGAGKQCAKTCSGTCPEGFGCTAVTGNGGDVVNLCLPAHPRICEPCMADSDCNNVLGGADSRCMPYKDKSGSLLGAYCGGSCDSDHPCPNGYECKEGTSVGGVKSAQCVRADLVCACDGRAVKMELTTTCSNANNLGTCTGTRKCGPTGLSSCTAATAQAEACNQQDDNCNGITDEPSTGMCDDGNPCDYDNCIAGECQHPPKTGPCDDGSKCSSADECVNGECTGKAAKCDDGNPCTDDSCALPGGCTHTTHC